MSALTGVRRCLGLATRRYRWQVLAWMVPLWLFLLGHPIALALVSPASPQAPDWPVGAQLSADVRGRMLPMSVVASPFYRRGR